MFLTYVLKRPDCNAPFWKEKFVTGLPNLFSQRIINHLQKEMGLDQIDFNLITYGQLFAFIKQEALSACQELKFQAKYGNNTAKDQKELIFDIIQDLPPEAQKKQLEKLKALILKEESSSARLVEPFSISKMFERYPHMNPQIKQNHTKELQTEINLLKAQVKELKERVFSVETKKLELDTQIALIQSKITKGKETKVVSEMDWSLANTMSRQMNHWSPQIVCLYKLKES
ncbi:hypothetical protein M9H77_02349 [Catharanthus roseus]|uniref:Uncharacterized protein n=1 Tax=Catharanthus roseus TaxID=4058 RepID=A0ACC0C8C7_CATRO|nr:hypothetical protein M9H77_02349 [Catharanthus roseus]